LITVMTMRGLRGSMLAIVLGGLGGCGNQAAPGAANDPVLLPGLAAQETKITGLTITVPGNTVAVRLRRRDGQWRVVEREEWLADPVRVDALLGSLSSLRGAEPKTDDPALYARLGLAPVAIADGRGIELRIDGPDVSRRLLIGIDHPGSGHTYVRVDGKARTWLADRALALPREPGDWLEHSLVELPLLRIAAVEVASNDAPRFVVERHVHGFAMATGGATLPAAPERAEALLGLLAPLVLRDLARDDGSPPERTLHYRAVDGLVVTLQAWRRDGRIWLRLSGSVDAERAAKWAGQAGPGATLADVQARAAAISLRGRGYCFELPAVAASVLMLGREQLLAKRGQG
jgi:hypothetical protein